MCRRPGSGPYRGCDANGEDCHRRKRVCKNPQQVVDAVEADHLRQLVRQKRRCCGSKKRHAQRQNRIVRKPEPERAGGACQQTMRTIECRKSPSCRLDQQDRVLCGSTAIEIIQLQFGKEIALGSVYLCRMTRRDLILSLLTPLRRYAVALTRNRGEADDLLQDTLLRGLEQRRTSFWRARRQGPDCARS